MPAAAKRRANGSKYISFTAPNHVPSRRRAHGSLIGRGPAEKAGNSEGFAALEHYVTFLNWHLPHSFNALMPRSRLVSLCFRKNTPYCGRSLVVSARVWPTTFLTWWFSFTWSTQAAFRCGSRSQRFAGGYQSQTGAPGGAAGRAARKSDHPYRGADGRGSGIPRPLHSHTGGNRRS